MAIINDGILGPFNNKVGTVIGRKFRGLDIMTGLYRERTNDSPSVDRLRQQARFGLLNSFLSDISTLVNPGFKKDVKKGQSPINAAFSYNFAHAFIESEVPTDADSAAIINDPEQSATASGSSESDQIDFDIALNFPKLVYSRGPVERPNCASVEFVAPDKIRFKWWPQQDNVNSRYNDQASLLIYSAASDKRAILLNKAQRSDLQYEIELPATYVGETFHCYMNFSDISGKRMGASEYVGTVETTV